VAPIAIVLHTMVGTLAAADSWFGMAVSQVSAHYGVSLGGVVHQYVRLADAAWANGIAEPGPGYAWPGPAGVNPNLLSVAIETEDLGSTTQPVTDAQYDAVLALCGALVLPAWAGIRYLVAHRAITPVDKPHCPGDRWLASGRFAQLAAALGLTEIS